MLDVLRIGTKATIVADFKGEYMEIEMQVLDCDYVMFNGKPLIRLFGKTIEGKAVCAFWDKTFPYFYLHCDESEFGSVSEVLKNKYSVSTEIVNRTIPKGYQQETKVLKINSTDPSRTFDIREFSRTLGTPFEADVLFKYRVMIDLGIVGMGWVKVTGEGVSTKAVRCQAITAESIEPIDKLENAPLKYMAFDIECVSHEDRLPIPEEDPMIMISIALSDEYMGKKTFVIVAKSVPPFDKDVISCDDEKAMLEKFSEILLGYDPDVLCGYNLNGFDIPYIVGRMQGMNLSRALGRVDDKSLTSKKLATGDYRSNIVGRVIADPFELIKKDPYISFKRYNLRTVAKEMLGMEKLDVGGMQDMRKLWHGNPENMGELVDYARRDSVLALKLTTECGLLEKFVEISKISGLLLQDSFGGQSQRLDCKMLHEFRKRGYIMPLKPDDNEMRYRNEERDKSGLKGAIVLDPEVGLHGDGCVLVLDFASLYPSIMTAFNICPTTLTLDESIDAYVSPSGSRFVKPEVREGIVPKIVKEFITSRRAVKKLMLEENDPEIKRMLNAKQLALKILANSMYGYTGYSRARLYMVEIASSITAYGRDNIMATRKLIDEQFKRKIVYGDSVTADRFVTVKDSSGLVKIVNVEKFFEKNNMNSFSRKDGKEFTTPANPVFALSLDPKTREPIWSKITKIIRHKTRKKVFRVGQKLGESSVTEDHSIMTLNGSNLEETKPNDMEGKSFVRVEKIPRSKFVNGVDLFEILSESTYNQQYKGRGKTSKPVLSDDGKYVSFGWMTRKKPIMVKRWITGKDLESLCRLIGAFIPEGSSSTKETSTRFGASIACSDTDWLRHLQQDFNRLFVNAKSSIIRSSKKPRTITTKSGTKKYIDKTYKLQMMNTLSAMVFKSLGGQKSSGKRLPDFVFNVPRKYQEIVLENMIKGDGSRKFFNKRLGYSDKYKKENFRYETKSLELASGTSLLLLILGRKYTMRYRPSKNTYILTTCSSYNSITKTSMTNEPYSGYVYDLEVEGSHMFVDSCGQVLLHNTDSIFVKTDLNDLDEAQKLGDEMARVATENMTGLTLEFEKIFKTFLILAKKRYAGWSFEKTKDGWKTKIDMKGIETVRRDWCSLVSDTMKDVLEVILKEQDVKKGEHIVREVLRELGSGKVDLDRLTVVKGVSKPIESYGGLNKVGGRTGIPAHVGLAKKMRERDPTLGSMVGSRIGYVIIKGNQMVSQRAEDPTFVRENGLAVDSQYYIENQLLPPLERIFDACGVSKDELLHGMKQKTLFDVLNGDVKSPEVTVLDGYDAVNCSRCSWSFSRVPLRGSCPECNSGLYFSYQGSLGKFVKAFSTKT